ncbi:MAG: hypothetical protein FJZ10_00010 [Candidatus Omnitrophica bacterium]|nr:hypothetical protein [Candidatus Omnitrophota bacterium]
MKYLKLLTMIIVMGLLLIPVVSFADPGDYLPGESNTYVPQISNELQKAEQQKKDREARFEAYEEIKNRIADGSALGVSVSATEAGVEQEEVVFVGRLDSIAGNPNEEPSVVMSTNEPDLGGDDTEPPAELVNNDLDAVAGNYGHPRGGKGDKIEAFGR